MAFGDRLLEARKAKGLTQKQLGGKIGASHNSVSDWEHNKNRPSPDAIELICGVLGVSPNYLLATSESDFSPAEKLLIKHYRSLDAHGKETVSYILDSEMRRMEQILMREEKAEYGGDIITLDFHQKVSAGSGQVLFDDMVVDRIIIPNKPEYKRVAYAVGVNGNSMEPKYKDGDILLVEPAFDVDIGQVGIFNVDGDGFVKKRGEKELISLT